MTVDWQIKDTCYINNLKQLLKTQQKVRGNNLKDELKSNNEKS